jgi:hypothetical protein
MAHALVFVLQNGLDVTPVIGILSDRSLFNPVLNKDEVEDIFDAPLEMFLKVLLRFVYLPIIEILQSVPIHFNKDICIVVFSLLSKSVG